MSRDVLTYHQPQMMYYRRDMWGAETPREEEMDKLKHPIRFVIFTHTVTPGTFTSNMDCIQAIKNCQNAHMRDNKWADIGFNYLIGNNGIIYEGRGSNYAGATAKGWNNLSLGIAFLGTYVDTMPSAKALEAAKLFLQDLVSKEILAPNFTIHCLRQVSTKFPQAPGNPLYTEIKTWKGTGPYGWAWREVGNTDVTDVIPHKSFDEVGMRVTRAHVVTTAIEGGTLDKERSQPNHDQLPKLCDKCLLHVADVTLGLHEVIAVLGKLDPGYILYLEDTVITRNARQTIQHAKNDDEALGLIRHALRNSLEPRKVERVLEVLNSQQMGKRIHAAEIQKYYHEQIRKHQCCMQCDTEKLG